MQRTSEVPEHGKAVMRQPVFESECRKHRITDLERSTTVSPSAQLLYTRLARGFDVPESESQALGLANTACADSARYLRPGQSTQTVSQVYLVD